MCLIGPMQYSRTYPSRVNAPCNLYYAPVSFPFLRKIISFGSHKSCLPDRTSKFVDYIVSYVIPFSNCVIVFSFDPKPICVLTIHYNRQWTNFMG